MSALLEAKNITVTAGAKTILKNCHLTAEKGEFIGILGPNGAGKSTFLKALSGLLPKAEGTVSIDGIDEKNLTDKDKAKKIAFMQQEFHTTFAYTAEEIVLSARYPYLKWWEREDEKDKEIARQWMAYTGVTHLSQKPMGTLSGGEKQRVILAKVLTQETPLLFLDEPTASLDLPYQEDIFRLCRKLCREGKTIFIVCHDLLMAAQWCSRLVLLHDKHFIADGKPEDVLTEKNLKQAFRLDALIYHDPFTKKLNLCTYEKKPPKEKTVWLQGNGPAAVPLLRRLFLAGYPVLYDPIPQSAIALAGPLFHGEEKKTDSPYDLCISTEPLPQEEKKPTYDGTEETESLLTLIDEGKL